MQQWEYLGVRLIPEADGGRVTVLDPARPAPGRTTT